MDCHDSRGNHSRGCLGALRRKGKGRNQLQTGEGESADPAEQRDCHRYHRGGDKCHRGYTGIRYCQQTLRRLQQPGEEGPVIAELDKTNLLSELNTAKANMASAQSQLNYQNANMKRYQTLYQKGLVSADDYENALLTYRQAKEQVATAKEQVQRAQTNLGYATITSPIDGTVISKSVEEGQTVAASFNTPELFTIAKDLTNMQVVADVDEADIGGVKEGDRVTFTVDAYPDDTFEGTVKQVRLQATTTNNVVTYEVVISAQNADLKLKPGLTANVTIYTQERTGVLAVANKALRFTPTKETVGKDMKIVDCKGKNKVWTLDGKTLTAHPVSIGQTDGMHTEITKGLKAGQQIVTEIVVNTPEDDSDDQQQSQGLIGGPRPRGKKK